MIHEQVAHLPAMAHFFRHHAAKRLAVVLARRVLEEAPLLLDRCELRVALVDDEIEQSIAHALVGKLDDLLPLGPALVRAKLDFIRPRRAKLGLELIIHDLRVGHPDVSLPHAEQIHPVVKRCKASCRHDSPSSSNFFAR